MEDFSNLFGRLVSKTSESSPSQAQESGDGLSLETIQIVRNVQYFLADEKMQVALYGSPSSYPDLI